MTHFQKSMARDGNGYMMNIGIGTILGYIICMVAMVSYYMHSINFGQEGIMGNLWALAPYIFAIGAMVIVSKWLLDPKFIILVGAVAGILFYVIFVL